MSHAPPQQPGYPQSNYPPQGMNYQPSPQPYYQQQQPYNQQQQTYPNQAYYGQGQVQMNYGHQPVITQQVVHVTPNQPATQPISSLQFKQESTLVQCPHCNHVVKTKISRKIGSTTFICCAVLSLVCCCCCPFCMDCTKDLEHTCPNCKRHLGLFKQPVIQSGGGTGGRSRHNYDHTFGGPGDDGCGRGPADYGGGDDGGGDGGGD